MTAMTWAEIAFAFGTVAAMTWTLFAGRPVTVGAKKLLNPVPTTWRSFDRRSPGRIERAI
jgi:hypothetical protein